MLCYVYFHSLAYYHLNFDPMCYSGYRSIMDITKYVRQAWAGMPNIVAFKVMCKSNPWCEGWYLISRWVMI